MRTINTSCAITRTTVPALDEILGHAFPVLDHGFVRVIDYMGDDAAVCQMARVSYGEGTKSAQDDRGLLRYLMRHWHTSPFEGCEIKLHVKLPIFVARQWIRHRTANVNEYSGRYSVMKTEFYIPETGRLGKQSTTNKQGTGAGYSGREANSIRADLLNVSQEAFDIYEMLIAEDCDLAREQARIILPLNTYTEWYWKVDLHNLLHFLRLRADNHAQWEIVQYAKVIADIVQKWVPEVWQAYLDYRQNAVTFSAMEVEAIKKWISMTYPDDPEYGGTGPVDCLENVSEREYSEFLAKVGIG